MTTLGILFSILAACVGLVASDMSAAVWNNAIMGHCVFALYNDL